MKSILVLLIAASLFGNYYQHRTAQEVDRASTLHVVAADAPVVMRTKGGLLEVSTIKMSEKFQSGSLDSSFRDSIWKTNTQIRVPVVYRYHIELAPEWKILLREKTFIVIAPAVKPTLPVAIDTAKIEKQSSGVWSFFSGNTLLDKLERSISPTLAAKASSSSNILLQREASRKTVEEFVAKWLVTQEQWKSASSYPIKVYFSDEPIQLLGNAALPVVALK